MQQIYGDLFKQSDADAICITTNGFIKKNGECVMGRGCAKQATEIYPNVTKLLGRCIKQDGNKVFVLSSINKPPILVSFPVKSSLEYCLPNKSNVVKHMRYQFNPNQPVPGWACVANLDIIKRSARQLVSLADKFDWRRVVLPRPGCGAGELQWENVYDALCGLLDDRFWYIDFSA